MKENKQETMLNAIRGVKINLPNVDEQKLFQNKCFELGLRWRDGSNNYREIGNPLMYIDKDLTLKHCVLYKQYNNLEYKEISLEQILELEHN